MKIGLIIEGDRVTAWQAEALALIAESNQFAIYNCTSISSSRRSFSHAFYYALNLTSLRNRLTRRTSIPPNLPAFASIDFEAEEDGQWQRLPASLLHRIAQDSPELILKFGMGLLRVPSPGELACPILSYHHGDPREYRGRPAGFYELLEGREVIGQVVQILSNSLDAGKVVAFGETKVRRHSYRATMKDAYRCSPLLLPKAIRNLARGQTMPIRPSGKIYRLPANGLVLRFLFKSLASLLRHIGYGAFFEKSWAVSEAHLSAADETMLSNFPGPHAWRALERPREYRFLADPFYHPDGDGILVEALRISTASGEILHLSSTGTERISAPGGHHSFPSTFSLEGDHFLLPEISDWSPPKLFRLRGSELEDLGELNIPGRPRLLDPVLHASGDTVFLFANLVSEGSSILRLWTSDSLFDRFVEHPDSPIRISPAGSRMAGAILTSEGGRFRLGQDFRGQYGDGVVLFRVVELSRTAYRETEIDQLRLSPAKGPHTVNFRAGSVVFDHYHDRFSLLAGVRRLRSRLAIVHQKSG